MKFEKLFPTILIVLDICAAVGYLPSHNWRMVVYWLAAAILTTCVTW
ncbi:MAG: hypothetical protein JEZ07_08820 [Phycisphaerae bacterium]|nr:hypothetical protein [Phycisphaerae bacterium]